MAVPMTVKIPEPITAPMPRAVSDTGPSVFFSLRSGFSESEISLSMDLQQNACVFDVRMTALAGSMGDGGNGSSSPQIEMWKMGSKARAKRSCPRQSLEGSSQRLAAVYRFA